MSTHEAIVTVAQHAPLESRQVPTVEPGPDEVLLRVNWTVTGPFDLHQNDGQLGVAKSPQIMGGNHASTVVKTGANVSTFQPGDKVFGFVWRGETERAHQEYLTVPSNLIGKIPSNVEAPAAATVPENLATIFHAAVTDLKLDVPWPKPDNWTPPADLVDAPILIWGGGSSVGIYAVQVFHWYGYRNIIMVASKKHWPMLQEMGARICVDYREQDLDAKLLEAAGGRLPLIFDCIGSKDGSMVPLARVAEKAAKVAVLMPAVIRDSAEDVLPIYSMDASTVLDWKDGVEVKSVRTHMYLQNETWARILQPEVIPYLLEKGIVKPNSQKYVEGATMLERAEKAMGMMRRKEVSGERLVWRVSEE